jgi:hypothetical protein
MKKILTAAGMIVVGTASLHAAMDSSLSDIERQKPWNISGTLRGFYDDNYTTLPSAAARDSFGFELSPRLSLNLPLSQSLLGASYKYSMKYYEDRRQNTADHSHEFNAKFEHAFTERYKIELADSFVIAQEPTVLNPSGIIVAPLRTDGNNVRNTALVNFTFELSPVSGGTFSYMNTFYDYEETGAGLRSSKLDRMEHLLLGDLRWNIQKSTTALVGYGFGITDYTSKEVFDTTTGALADTRDSRTHKVFLGADHLFIPELTGSARAGLQFTEYYHTTTVSDSVGPYADAKLSYSYKPGSYVQVGFRHERSTTDLSTAQDQETSAIYLSLSHKITGDLSANLLLQGQHSDTKSHAAAPDVSENFYIAGISLSYQINPHLSVETGYNYDKLESDSTTARSYTRNRAYIGIRATY